MIGWQEPTPTLVVNDETGEWVMTHNITKVTKRQGGGSDVYVRADGYGEAAFGKSCKIGSPLTPRELRDRLFDKGELK